MKNLILLILLSGCGDALKTDCNPNVYPDDCSSSEKCNASNKKCETVVDCTDFNQCSGYECTISAVCNRNCSGQGMLPDSSLCAPGYLCNSTKRTCDKVTTCDPAAANPCNGLTCDANAKTCS